MGRQQDTIKYIYNPPVKGRITTKALCSQNKALFSVIFITGTLSCVYPIAVLVEHFALVVNDVHYSIHSEDTCADILVSRIYR